jgi:GNAT superfamily N-acetyltransferase
MSAIHAEKSVSVRAYRGDVDFPALVAFIAMQYEHEREFQKLERKHGGKVAPRYAEDLLRAVEAHEGCLFMADIGSNPVGFIAAYCMSDPDPILDETARRHGHVRDLFVLPNWRRMKIAHRLLAEAEGHFRTIGISRLRIAGVAQNEAMTGLCKSCGFAPHAIVFDRAIPMPMKGTRT